MSAAETTALATATAAYRSGAVTVTTLMILPARCALMMVADLPHAAWSQVRAVLGDFDGIWLIALVGALLVSFVGYHYAYRGIFRVESALCGMALFWAADALATWAGLAMFGLRMNAAALFVGFATGMVFTRRTGPLAGAGVLAQVLPLTIWVSGAPLAAAVAGVFVYRVLALLLPMPVSLAVLPTLRQMAQRPASHAGGTEGVKEPALQPAAGNQGIKGSS